MEQVPGSRTEAQKLLLFPALSIRRVSTGAKGSVYSRSRSAAEAHIRARAEGRTSIILLIFVASAAARCAVTGERRLGGKMAISTDGLEAIWYITGMVVNAWGRTRRAGLLWLLVSIIMNNAWEEFFSASRKFMDGFLCRTVFPGPFRGLGSARETR